MAMGLKRTGIIEEIEKNWKIDKSWYELSNSFYFFGLKILTVLKSTLKALLFATKLRSVAQLVLKWDDFEDELSGWTDWCMVLQM